MFILSDMILIVSDIVCSSFMISCLDTDFDVFFCFLDSNILEYSSEKAEPTTPTGKDKATIPKYIKMTAIKRPVVDVGYKSPIY